MEVLINHRGGGLTTDLIKRAAEINGVLVVTTAQQKEYAKERAVRLGLLIKEPITINKFADKTFYKEGEKFLFDDIESLLRVLGCTGEIDTIGISMNHEG